MKRYLYESRRVAGRPVRRGSRRRLYEGNRISDLDVRWSSHDWEDTVDEFKEEVASLSKADYIKLKAALELHPEGLDRALGLVYDLDAVTVDPKIRNYTEAGRVMYNTGWLCGADCSQYMDDYFDSNPSNSGKPTDKELSNLAKSFINEVNRNNYMGFTSEGLCDIDTM